MKRRDFYFHQQYHRANSYRPFYRKSLDINPDLYVRSHDVDPRLETAFHHFRPRTFLAHVEQNCLLRMPRAIYLIIVMTHTGIILACALASKQKNGRANLSNSSPEAITKESEASLIDKSKQLGSPSKPVEKITQCKKAPFLTNFWETIMSEKTGITSAILTSCFQHWIASKEKNVASISETKSTKEAFGGQDLPKPVILANGTQSKEQSAGNADMSTDIEIERCLPMYSESCVAHSEQGKEDKSSVVLPFLSPQKSDTVTYEENCETNSFDSPRTKCSTNSPSTKHNFVSLSATETSIDRRPEQSNLFPTQAFQAPLEEIHSALAYLRKGVDILLNQEATQTQPQQSTSGTSRSSASPLVSRLVESLVARTPKKILSDDASSSTNHVSQAQLLSLLLLPEACV